MRAVIRIGFNPRTHTGCDDDKPASGNYYDGFNPRTHTGCDVVSDELEQVEKVSIHAPTRGATHPSHIPYRFHIVSIHAPTRGATARQLWNTRTASRFNPRTHTGCDTTFFPTVVSVGSFQSTHPHGVRLESKTIQIAEQCFNPRTHTGCDAINITFNPCENSFNPRTHTGCDSTAAQGVASLIQFQSTHPHGVRRIGAA